MVGATASRLLLAPRPPMGLPAGQRLAALEVLEAFTGRFIAGPSIVGLMLEEARESR